MRVSQASKRTPFNRPIVSGAAISWPARAETRVEVIYGERASVATSDIIKADHSAGMQAAIEALIVAVEISDPTELPSHGIRWRPNRAQSTSSTRPVRLETRAATLEFG